MVFVGIPIRSGIAIVVGIEIAIKISVKISVEIAIKIGIGIGTRTMSLQGCPFRLGLVAAWDYPNPNHSSVKLVPTPSWVPWFPHESSWGWF